MSLTLVEEQQYISSLMMMMIIILNTKLSCLGVTQMGSTSYHLPQYIQNKPLNKLVLRAEKRSMIVSNGTHYRTEKYYSLDNRSADFLVWLCDQFKGGGEWFMLMKVLKYLGKWLIFWNSVSKRSVKGFKWAFVHIRLKSWLLGCT